MSLLNGKKLLVMGGKPVASCDIVKYAKSKGVYTIVTDYLDDRDSLAKLIADESWKISTADVDEIEHLVNKRNINGVFTGAHEFNIEKTLTLCERLGLPFYCNRKQWNVCSNKALFKQLCRDQHVPVVVEYFMDNIIHAKKGCHINYPVVIKPVDSSGGRGLFICHTKEELMKNYKKSISCSKSKSVIVERYMTSEEVVIYYTIQEGYISLSAMCDRYTNKEQCSVGQIPTAYIYPSKYLTLFQNTLDRAVRNMFEAIGLENGVLFIQSFVENGKFYFYEMGYRLNGAQEFRFVSRINGINTLEMMINYALTGKTSGWDVKKHDNPNFKSWCCKLTPIAKPGKIGKIIGLEEIALLPEVVDIVPMNYEGDTIKPEDVGTLRQVITRIFIIASDKYILSKVINKIYSKIKVLSIEGDNMLLDGFDTELLNY